MKSDSENENEFEDAVESLEPHSSKTHQNTASNNNDILVDSNNIGLSNPLTGNNAAASSFVKVRRGQPRHMCPEEGYRNANNYSLFSLINKSPLRLAEGV